MEFLINRQDCMLYGRKTGRGPMLLLIHGIACDSTYFSETVSYLKRKFTVITYDRRGYGKSTGKEETDFSVQAQVEDAAEVIHFFHGKQVYVAGCSFGGFLAYNLTIYYPDLVKFLILHEPPLPKPGEYREEIMEWLAELRRIRQSESVSRLLLAFASVLGGVDSRASKKSQSLLEKNITYLKHFTDYEMEYFYEFLREMYDLQWVSCSCVLAAGEKDKEGLFCKYGECSAGFLNAKFVNVPGYHNAANELPYEFAVMIAGILSLED